MGVARAAAQTVGCIDQYCNFYRQVFPDVRSFEHFKYLHVGLVSELKRKTLPAIAKMLGLKNGQGLHHFLTQSPWAVESLRKRRLELLKKALGGRSFILCIDETGDRKKGKSTDYVARQYIGNLGKVENGIVSVNAYGILGTTVFPLLFKVFKPRKRLKESDEYKTKPELAVEILNELVELGFNFKLVLADSLYGESSTFISALQEIDVRYVVAIRSNHGVWLAPEQSVRITDWQEFERVFSDGDCQKRYLREIIFGRRRDCRYYEITTDPNELPSETTWYIMSDLSGELQKEVGNFYGLRTWIEYGLKQSKNELGWADYRLTNHHHIERWWESVFCAYLMVSLQAEDFSSNNESSTTNMSVNNASRQSFHWQHHPFWNEGHRWSDILHNLRLILQPYLTFCSMIDWIGLLSLKQLSICLRNLRKMSYQIPLLIPI